MILINDMIYNQHLENIPEVYKVIKLPPPLPAATNKSMHQ